MCANENCNTKNYKDDMCRKHYIAHSKLIVDKTDDDGNLLKFCNRCYKFKIETTFRTITNAVSANCGICYENMRQKDAKRRTRVRDRRQYRIEDGVKIETGYVNTYRQKQIDENKEEFNRKNAEKVRRHRAKKAAN